MNPYDAMRRRIAVDAALEIDVVAIHNWIRIQIATEFQFSRWSNWFFKKFKSIRVM